jgi:hypothetical protein
MKRHLMSVTLAASFAVLSAAPAFARDTVENYPIEPALHSEPGKVSDDIALYFAGQRHPAVAKTIGEFATNKKTNAFGKSDTDACQHVFLSAVIELQDRAQGRRQRGHQHQEQLQERSARERDRVHLRRGRRDCRRRAEGRCGHAA